MGGWRLALSVGFEMWQRRRPPRRTLARTALCVWCVVLVMSAGWRCAIRVRRQAPRVKAYICFTFVCGVVIFPRHGERWRVDVCAVEACTSVPCSFTFGEEQQLMRACLRDDAHCFFFLRKLLLKVEVKRLMFWLNCGVTVACERNDVAEESTRSFATMTESWSAPEGLGIGTQEK